MPRQSSLYVALVKSMYRAVSFIEAGLGLLCQSHKVSFGIRNYVDGSGNIWCLHKPIGQEIRLVRTHRINLHLYPRFVINFALQVGEGIKTGGHLFFRFALLELDLHGEITLNCT